MKSSSRSKSAKKERSLSKKDSHQQDSYTSKSKKAASSQRQFKKSFAQSLDNF
jgi:hypothetical protein